MKNQELDKLIEKQKYIDTEINKLQSNFNNEIKHYINEKMRLVSEIEKILFKETIKNINSLECNEKLDFYDDLIIENLVISYIWKCDNPYFPYCVYDDKHDRYHNFCLNCGNPEERK